VGHLVLCRPRALPRRFRAGRCPPRRQIVVRIARATLDGEHAPIDRQLPWVRACWRYTPSRYCLRPMLLVMRVGLVERA
jgi:hypothetical protein